jgi:NAD dependent epimerase/dehydratase family enzyme
VIKVTSQRLAEIVTEQVCPCCAADDQRAAAEQGRGCLFVSFDDQEGEWLSWIHIDDLTGIVHYLINHDTLNGPFNCTSPYPETNRDFSRKLGTVLKRPVWVRVPGWLVQFQAGGIARLYLTGQKVLPRKLLESGYRFRFPELTEALEDILI